MFLTRKYQIVATVLTSALFASIVFAQQPQTPSQRFSPERNVPPSVHVPDSNARNLNSNQANSGTNSTSFNFSDTPSTAFRQASPNQNRSTRQVSYDQELPARHQLPEIPAVLRNSNGQSKQPISTVGKFEKTGEKIHQLRPPTQVTRQNQNGGHQIVVDKGEFENHQQQLDDQIEALNQLRDKTTRTSGMSRHPDGTAKTNVQQVAFTQRSDSTASDISAAATKGSGKDEKAIQTADYNSQNTGSESRQEIRNVSAESEMIPGASLKLTAPGIRVQVFGPESIGINKIATYKITASNEGSEDAKDLQIGISLPANIDLQNINVSTGHHEITDGVEQSRLNWNIERISAGTTHTIAINAIPRTADPFEMGVEWKFAPRIGSTHIQVTQPQLEMQIAGPTEVLFGEKATYDVTVVNPGTGIAEQVSVMLPEALGGERANIGDVPAGGEKKFKVELFARTAGQLNLAATAIGEGNIKASAQQDILVRRANLTVEIDGPPMKYAGGLGQYVVTIANDGDATASDVAAVLAMPTGVKYIGGINNVEHNDNGLKWNIGTLTSGDRRTFKVNCQLDASGNLFFQAGARGAGDLAATNECQTKVDTIADLTLDVEDPKGPLPTGEDITYRLIIRNRGSRSANSVDLVMQFSEGIEPIKAEGVKNKIVTGQVIFSPISRIEPGQEVELTVTAQALKSGTHIFRGQLTCEESDSREIAEGTTRFFGDDFVTDAQQITLPSKVNTADASDELTNDSNDFK